MDTFECQILFRYQSTTLFYFLSCSQKDLENLKAEVQRRQQQQQELGKIEEPSADGLLELEDKIPVD